MRINDTIAEMSEYIAKALHTGTSCKRNQSATIPTKDSIPDAATRIRCIFPLRVMNSPPSSRGKQIATSIPKIELIFFT